ncbi:hypothetical protein GCM10020254_65100 [Streptomyces goshikiensis]
MLVEDADDGVGARDSDGEGAGDRVDGCLAVRGHGGAGGGGLGEAVSAPQVEAEGGAQPFHEGGRERGAAAGEHPERGEVVRGDVRVGGEGHERGRRADGVVGAVFEEGVEDDARVEAVGQDEGAGVGEAGGELADHPGDVEERGEGEVARALGDGVAGDLPQGVVGERPVGGSWRPWGVPEVPEV